MSNVRIIDSKAGAMQILIKIEGEQLERLRNMIAHADTRHIRIAVDGGQLKLKVNEFTWTPPLGEVKVGEAAQ